MQPFPLTFEADEQPGDTFAIRGHFFGTVSLDSHVLVVQVDSAAFQSLHGPAILGGLNVALAREVGRKWEIRPGSLSRTLLLDSVVTSDRPLVLKDLVFTIERGRLTTLSKTWLVFTLVTGNTRTDTGPGIAFAYAHSPRGLFTASLLPREPHQPPDTPAPFGITEAAMIEGSCDIPASQVRGSAMAAFTLDTLGRVVSSVTLSQVSGNVTEAAVEQVVTRCRYRPSRIDGRAVRTRAYQAVTFQ